MVSDGIRYGATLSLAAVLLAWLAGVWFALPPLAAALFLLYFFRDPERLVSNDPGPVVVSPADGRVVDIRAVDIRAGEHQGRPVRRISIFLSPFDVHVNRAPIAGFIRDVQYSPGRFRMATRPEASVENESNLVTVEGPEGVVVFKQIAGLVARRIVFWKKQGDHVARGERVGLIKLGSRVDVFLDSSWEILVSRRTRVRAGTTILARRN